VCVWVCARARARERRGSDGGARFRQRDSSCQNIFSFILEQQFSLAAKLDLIPESACVCAKLDLIPESACVCVAG